MNNVGEYKVRITCRLCGSKKLVPVLDLGKAPLAGAYMRPQDVGKENLYPLTLSACQECAFVQVSEIIDPKILFADYRYLSSVPLAKHFQKYADEMVFRFLKKGDFVVEIGSNDGVLLGPLDKAGMNILGIDPAANVVKIANEKGLETITGYFTSRLAKDMAENIGPVDAIFANNVLAHIDNVDDVFKGIDTLLRPSGVLVFEVYYLADLIHKKQYDIVYHEHHSYYSLTSLVPFLKKHGLEIFDVRHISTHSGSIRVYCQKINRGNRLVTKRFGNILKQENKMKLSSPQTYMVFGAVAKKNAKQILDILTKLKQEGKRIVGYGASGRGNMLLNFVGIDSNILDYIVDESPERYGRITPSTHIKIVPPEIFREDNPDYVFLLAWGYKEMIMEKEKEFIKRGGKFIIPLPKVEVL